MNRMWFVAAAFLFACTSKKPPSTDPSPSGSAEPVAEAGSGSMAEMKPGTPKPSVTWVKGPALTSSASDLIAWLDAQKRGTEPRMTRVLIVMTKGKTGWSTHGVKLGAVEVHIIDSALGSSMAMRALRCTTPTCSFIVEGFWKGQSEGGYQYEIRNASKTPATAEEVAAFTHAEVEGESGN
jgi:hypothetical protein